MTTHYSAADVGVLIEASERVCRLVANGSPRMAVVRSCKPAATTLPVIPKTVTSDASVQNDRAHSLQLPKSIRNQAQEFAAAHGVSLDQYVAAAVREKVTSLCVPETTKWNTGHWRRRGSVRADS